MMLKIKDWFIKYRLEILTKTILILSGCLGHFIHEIFDNEIVIKVLGVLFPVNETTWEHMKLLWYPFLFAGIILSIKEKNWGYFGSFTVCGLLSILAVLGAFAIYESYSIVALVLPDIILVMMCFIFLGLLAFHLAKQEFMKKSLIFWIVIAVLITASIITLTYIPGDGYIFKDNEGLKEAFAK